MDRFLVRQTASDEVVVRATVAVSRGDRRQRTLHGLKKVVGMGKTSVIVFSDADLAEACSILGNRDSTTEDKLQSLRRLSCWQISRANLLQSPQVGRQVRLLKHHRNQDVAALASRLVQKWKDIILSGRPTEAQRAPVEAILSSPDDPEQAEQTSIPPATVLPGSLVPS